MTKQKHIIYFILILCISLFTSCNIGMIQKAYITNPPNVSLFDSANAFSIKIECNARYFDQQFSYAISDKWGISSDFLIGAFGQLGGDAGLVYYKHFNNKSYFELVGGYGYFRFHAKNSGVPLDFAYDPSTWYSYDIKTAYHRPYIQPSIFTKAGTTDLGLTLRISAPYFTRYKTYYDITTYESDEEYPPYEYGSADLKNKLSLMFEPMMTVRFEKFKMRRGDSPEIFFQIGGCFAANNIDYLKAYESHDVGFGGPTHYHQIEQPFPLHANFFINFGLEFGNGTKKYSTKRKGWEEYLKEYNQ